MSYWLQKSMTSTSHTPSISSRVLASLADALPFIPLDIARVVHSYFTHPHSHLIYRFGNKSATSLLLDTQTPDAKWQALPKMSVDRSIFSVTQFEHQFFVLCSINGNRFGSGKLITCFDTTTCTWSSTTMDIDVHRSHHAFVVCDGVMYRIGGVLNAVADEMIGTPTGVTRNLEYEGKWLHMPPMHQARYAFSAIVCEGKIYVMGGSESSRKRMQECECFDPATQEWSVIAPMSVPRSYAECILIPHSTRVGMSMIAVMGGLAGNDHQHCVAGDVELYDPIHNRWNMASWTLPSLRYNFSAHCVNGDGDIVICGGLGPTGVLQDRCEILTLSTRTWKSMPALPTGYFAAGFDY